MIEDRDIPLELVRRYVDAMASTFGAHLGKRGAVLDGALTVLGTSPSDYATTIGHELMTPAPLGTVELVALGWSPWSQISVVAHECMHIVESDETGLVEHAWSYLTSGSRRQELECRAMLAQLELEIWRRGVVAEWWPRVYADALRAYHVSDADLSVAERYLRAAAATVRAGGIITPSGRVAIAWLDEHAPELRAPDAPPRRA